MKKYIRNFGYRFGGVIAAFALVITTLNVNSTCVYFAHQPKLPESAKKLRKF